MPLKIRPGRYLTRDGRVAEKVERRVGDDARARQWMGFVAGYGQCCWTDSGWRWEDGVHSCLDLIRRLPSKPKRKTVKAQSGAVRKRYTYLYTVLIDSTHAISRDNLMVCVGHGINDKKKRSHSTRFVELKRRVKRGG